MKKWLIPTCCVVFVASFITCLVAYPVLAVGVAVVAASLVWPLLSWLEKPRQ